MSPLDYLRRWHRPVEEELVVEVGDGPEGRVLVPTAYDVTGEPCGWIWADPDSADEWDIRLWGSSP